MKLYCLICFILFVLLEKGESVIQKWITDGYFQRIIVTGGNNLNIEERNTL